MTAGPPSREGIVSSCGSAVPDPGRQVVFFLNKKMITVFKKIYDNSESALVNMRNVWHTGKRKVIL
jgi:hypothetical protein